MSPRFAAERPLGKLAKWLRILGFDTAYQAGGCLEKFVRNLESGRILLCRSRRLPERWLSTDTIRIESDHLPEQLKQVVTVLQLSENDFHLFSRCIRCNLPIVELDKDMVRGKVPDFVWETQDSFSCCPACKRIFWSGSHLGRSQRQVQRLLDIVR
jgi:uncharacterized protein with PIN domain